jgi:hypothetical protein
LSALGATDLAPDDIVRTIGTIAKTPDDRDAVAAALGVRRPASDQETSQ